MEPLGSVLAILAIVTVALCDQHKIVQKSLQRARGECALYSASEDCRIRCTTLLTRDWTDGEQIRSVYNRFYRPDPSDQCNHNRTQRCLNAVKLRAPSEQVCLRASDDVQCYLDQYGEVVLDQPKFIKSTKLQQEQIVLDCGAILGFSPERLSEVLADSNYDLLDTRCLFRCYLIRSGLYSDVLGLNMERFYVACGGYEAGFYEVAKQCMVDVRNRFPCDKCTLAQKMTMECIGSKFDTSITYNDPTVSADRGSTITVIHQNNQNINSVINNFKA